MVYKHAYLNTLLHSAFMLCMVMMVLKAEIGGPALNCHGNIVDHGKIMELCFEFLWEPCIRESSGSVVECSTRDRRAAGLSLTGITVLCD